MNWTFNQEKVLSYITLYGGRLLVAILIILIGRYVARISGRLVRSAMLKTKTGDTLASFVSNVINFGIMIFVIIAALSKLGIQTTSFVAIIGAAGLAIGLALQGSLANLAAGVMMVIFHPFKLGDDITAGGVTGKVHDIQIFSSIILTPDNKTIIVPNAKLTSDAIVNYTARGTRRVDMAFTVKAPDVETARKMICDLIDQDTRILKEPAPLIQVTDIGDGTFSFNVQPHVASNDYAAVLNDVTEKVKLAFYHLNIA